MKVLARIPAIDAAAIMVAGGAGPICPDVAGSAETSARPTAAAEGGRLRGRRRPSRSRFPTASVTVLAVLAAIAWSLASWSDAHRAERSRLERLARMEPVTSSPGTVAR